MMKKICNLLLMAAVVCGLSLFVTSCKDDDDDVNDEVVVVEGDPYQKTGDVASALFVVMNQLADVDSLPDNWQTTEFEPAIGRVVDASQPYVRAMAVQNVRSARDVFRSLIGENFDESKSTVTWRRDGVGTLVYQELNQGDCVATIDVQLPQMPHLTQLRLLPPSAFGDNTMKYQTYYSIGDVVEDKDGCYWICVRSAGGPDQKEKTHWISMQMLKDNSKASGFKSNVKTITTKGHAIQVPQNLGGTEVKHLKYFAQLMYLLQRPDEYAQNAQAGGVLEGGLGDLGVGNDDDDNDDGEAISPEKLQNIAKLWNFYDVWSRVLPQGVTKDFFLSGDVRMIYNGHSNATFSSTVNLYVCSQTGTCLSEQHLSTPEWDKKDATKEFNINEYISNGRAATSNINGIANANGQAIVVRMCTGKELANNLMFQPDYYEPITNVKNHLLNRFRASRYCPYYRIGDVFKDDEGSRWMVIRSAGIYDPDSCQQNSNYSLLVTFDNIKTSADNTYATNLPQRDVAIEAMTLMHHIANGYMLTKNDPDRLQEWGDPNNARVQTQVMYNFYKYADVDLIWLFDVSQSPKGPRNYFIHACCAYDDGTRRQKLLRYINDTEEAGNHSCCSFWERYPLNNTTRYERPNPLQFKNGNEEKIKIGMEDTSYPDMVEKYAADFYATQPFATLEGETVPRAPRTQTDSRATKVPNFFYDRQKMQSRSLPLSMWNEPVLFFRAVRLADQGPDRYEKTIEGRKLTPLSKYPYDSRVSSPYWINVSAAIILPIDVLYNLLYVSGNKYRVPLPLWQE